MYNNMITMLQVEVVVQINRFSHFHSGYTRKILYFKTFRYFHQSFWHSRLPHPSLQAVQVTHTSKFQTRRQHQERVTAGPVQNLMTTHLPIYTYQHEKQMTGQAMFIILIEFPLCLCSRHNLVHNNLVHIHEQAQTLISHGNNAMTNCYS